MEKNQREMNRTGYPGRFDRGSYLLSTALGVAVLLSFFGLAVGTVRFLHLRGGLEHAVQKTARCLATDSPACQGSNIVSTDFATDWWGSSSRVSEEKSVDRYRYSGRYYNDTYKATASYFESSENAQSFSLPLRNLPVVRYTPYNTDERRYAEVVKTWTAPSNVVTPASETTISFDLAFEQLTANLSPEDYLTAVAQRSPDIVFREAALGGFNISPSVGRQALGRQTRRTAVIPAPFVQEGVTCAAGRDCLADCRTAQESCPAEFPPRQFYVLLKPFFVSANADKINIPDGGFRVNVFDAQGSKLYERNLGGRLPDESSSDWRSLWLRGPSGSSGDRAQLSNHSAIAVPNGGAFQVELTLESLEKSKPISAEAVLYYHLPTFEYLPGIETSTRCQVELRPSASDLCLAEVVDCREVCGVPEQGSCRVEKEWGEPVCRANGAIGADERYFPLACRGITHSPLDAEAVVCSEDWQPTMDLKNSASALRGSTVYAGEKRKWCGFWKAAEVTGEVEVPLRASNCPLLEQDTSYAQVECSLIDQDINSANEAGKSETPQAMAWLDKCLQLRDSLDLWGERLLRLNQRQLKLGAIRFAKPVVSDFIAGPLIPQTKLLFWEKPELHPLRSVRQIRQDSKPLSWIRRVSSAAPSIPQAMDFSFPDETPALTGGYGAGVSINRTVESTVALNDGSVFGVINDTSGKEKGSPELDAGYRHGVADCSGEKIVSDNCPVYNSLTELLREKAGESYPILADKDMFVELDEPIYLTTEQITVTKGQVKDEIAGCYAYRHLCQGSEKLVYLGKFSRKEYPDGPPDCQDGEYSYCYSSGDEFFTPLASQTMDLAEEERLLVKRYFAEELRRALPDSTGECSSDSPDATSCFSMNYARNQFDSVVSADYRLPLIAPFNWVLGREVQLVSFSKREVNER